MNVFRDVRIGMRLLSSFAVLGILLVAIGWFGIRGVLAIGEDLDNLFNVRLSSLDLLLQVDRDLQQLLVAERSLFLTEPNTSAFDDQVKEYESNLKQSTERWELYKALDLTSEEKALIPQYENFRAKWKEVSRHVIEQRMSTSPQEREAALALCMSKDKANFEQMRDIIDQLTEMNERIAKETHNQAQALRSSVLFKISGGTAVGLLVSLVLALLITRSIAIPLRKCVVFSDRISSGDLDAVLDVHQRDESGRLADGLRTMVERLKEKIAEAEIKGDEARLETEKVKHAVTKAEEAQAQAERAKEEGMLHAATELEGVVEILTSASEQLSAQIEQSSRGAQEQALRISGTATSMEEMNATVFEVAQNASHAATAADEAAQKAEAGANVVSQAVQRISDVERQSQEMKADMSMLGKQAEGIGQIMNVISDIADQTNLLALNAAIEAARAGEAGRGFAVVADEVRKLAEKTMSATKDVGNAIRDIQAGTKTNIENVERSGITIEDATALVNQSGEALHEIVSLVESTTDQVRSIATASEEQSSASEEINRNVEDISRISSETMDTMQQSAEAVVELAKQAQVMKTLIERMKGDTGTTGRHMLT
ncbi:HAMP domain-containing methyl-accepting chemotaxis protein [Desulfovibrio inopinatus]|uniref:HAMP domain-containing methyl-accepting chemotaxis protein n=1 Tax=Desulfovibrio inopinatus TaxID=102109 RepID=UPI000405FA30|nr:methyl-accepting chemotaxis protein [Desulfovibrio inopinatus]